MLREHLHLKVLQRPLESAQYTAIRYMLRLDNGGALASIGSIGDSYDNAMAESLIGLYKTECIALDGPFRTVAELELATCDWVHWFNHERLHSSIGYNTPIEFEHEYYRQNNTRQQPLSAITQPPQNPGRFREKFPANATSSIASSVRPAIANDGTSPNCCG
jgi:hypothetical protein